MNTLLTTAKESREIALLKGKFDPIRVGQNILLKVGNTYSLMKYENHNIEVEHHSSHRHNRHICINTSLGDYLFADTEEKRHKLAQRHQREWKRHKGNIYSTHRLDFVFDEEFEIYLPCSKDRDLFLTLARETAGGEIVSREDVIEIITDEEPIVSKLQEITRPRYFETVIIPFLTGKYTEFEVPKLSKRWFRKANRFTFLNRFEIATKALNNGTFVYVGSKEEVYLLGLARDDDGRPYMQGTYSTSTKPMFYFSNNYLHGISKYDAKKPKFNGGKACNVAVYRTYDIPGFDGHPFIFPQMGRGQNCKNTIFTGEPQVITGDMDEALTHFATTDFAEFADIVEKYAEQIDIIHPASEKLNGRFYY